MAAFAAISEARFVAYVVGHLREDAPEVVGEATDEEVAELARHGVARAATYGITTSPLVLQYITLMTWLGADFDVAPEHAWAAEILESPTLGPKEKLFRLEDYVMTEWEGARECP
jgi:hypothetical protein